MVAVKIQAFGGMIPVMDPRLLPDNHASDAVNVWLYKGALQGQPRPYKVADIDVATRYVYRIPQTDDPRDFTNSHWLEFTTTDTSVVKSPVASSEDPAYYWANGNNPPGYTTMSRLDASDPALVLGIPSPGTPPVVTPTGGVSATTETRAYVYTWVSDYGEEGPPSEPTLATGKIDDTWTIDVTAPTGGESTDRALTTTRIYRTVTNDQGVAVYYYVTEFAIATLTYGDTADSDEVAANEELASLDWIAPPTDLQGICTMANGVIAGWRENEIWFCEPYRPHAWPARYQIAVEFPIVAMVAAGQTLVIGTRSMPYFVTGTRPDTMTLQRVAAIEPCVSRGSMTATPQGVQYASQNGLILAASGTVQNVTRNIISKDEWAELLDLKQLRAAILNEAYFVYGGVQEQAFQADAFQTDAFQQDDGDGTRRGALIEGQDLRVAFSRLEANDVIYNVIQDAWTGEVLLVREGLVQLMDLTTDNIREYTWKSKLFELPHPMNLGACKVTWNLPIEVIDPSTTMRIYANGVLRQTKVLPATDQVFRLKGGFLADNYQFELEGNLNITGVQLASTIEELRRV